MAWLMGQEEHATPVMECDYVEEGIDLQNITISWEGETSNVTLPLSHKNSSVIHAIVDGGSGVNIISRETYDKWGLPPLEKAPYTIKLADQSRVTPVGLARDVPVRLAGVRFVMSFAVMDLPQHSSSFSALLGRPWLRAVAALHDWRNNTLQFQSRDGAVKVNLKDGKIRPIVPRGSEPSSSSSTASTDSKISQLPSGMSSEYCMNWMSALALIDCNTITVEAIKEVQKIDSDQALNHTVVLKESDIESTWNEFKSVSTTYSVGEKDLSGFPEPEANVAEKDEEAYDLLWLEAEMDKYCLSYSSGESDDNLAHAEEAKNPHNVARRATKKNRRIKKKNPTQTGVYQALRRHRRKRKHTGDGLCWIDHIYSTGVVMRQKRDGNHFPELVHGRRLREYHYPAEEPPELVIPPR